MRVCRRATEHGVMFRGWEFSSRCFQTENIFSDDSAPSLPRCNLGLSSFAKHRLESIN